MKPFLFQRIASTYRTLSWEWNPKGPVSPSAANYQLLTYQDSAVCQVLCRSFLTWTILLAAGVKALLMAAQCPLTLPHIGYSRFVWFAQQGRFSPAPRPLKTHRRQLSNLLLIAIMSYLSTCSRLVKTQLALHLWCRGGKRFRNLQTFHSCYDDHQDYAFQKPIINRFR